MAAKKIAKSGLGLLQSGIDSAQKLDMYKKVVAGDTGLLKYMSEAMGIGEDDVMRRAGNAIRKSEQKSAQKGLLDTPKTDLDADMMFIHGTDPKKMGLYDMIGGQPMPSLAVTQKDIPFDWGSIDLIGKKKNFAPENNPLNDLYSADAYTVRSRMPLRKPKKNAWKAFQDDFGNVSDFVQKLDNKSPYVYSDIQDFLAGRFRYKAQLKFAEDKGIDIPRKKDGTVDNVSLKQSIEDNFNNEYSDWVDSKLDKYFDDELFYLDDNNKLKLYDAEAMTKIMKKQRGKGTEGVTGTSGYDKAMGAEKFKSLSEAKSKKQLLMQKQIADQKFNEMDYTDLPPTQYFESKPARTVSLNEYAGAIVPSNIDKKTLNILESRGIPVVKYADDAERIKARDKFKSEMFSNPYATMGAPVAGSGLLALGLTPDEARAAQIAATDTRDIGSIQAARNPRLQRAAGLLGSIDTPIGSLFESTPNVLNRWAYGEEADAMDKLGMALELMP